jgi:hypothetical protein
VLVLRQLAVIGVSGLLVLAAVGLLMFATDRDADLPPCSRGSTAALMTGCAPGQRSLSFEEVMTFQRPAGHRHGPTRARSRAKRPAKRRTRRINRLFTTIPAPPERCNLHQIVWSGRRDMTRMQDLEDQIARAERLERSITDMLTIERLRHFAAECRRERERLSQQRCAA